MKLGVLVGLPFLLLGGLPVMAQSQQRVDCYRDSYNYTITCPGYGSFDYRQNGNDYNNNNDYNNDYNNNNNNRYNRSNSAAAIDNLYNEVLGRDADRRGVVTYRQALERGATLEQVRNDLANSSEADQVINRIYRQILGRNADSAGLNTYKRYLASGGSIDQVRRDLANSVEARNRRR